MPVLGRATLELNADSARLEQDLGRAVQQAATLGTAIGTVLGQAINAGVDKLTSMVSKAIETGDELSKLSQKTGISVETLSELRVAAELSNVSLGNLKTGIKQLYENLSTAGRVDGKAKSAFEAIGLDVEKLRALKPDEMFRAVAMELAKYEDGANKSALATAMLGRSGAELIPMINELQKTEKIAKELGITMSGETAAAAERFKDNMTMARIASEAIGMRIAQVLLPTLEKLSGFLVDNAKNTERLDTVTRAADAGLKILATGVTILGTAFEIVGGQIGRMAAVFGAVVRGDFRAAGILARDTVADVGTAIGEAAGKIHMIWEDTGNKIAASAEKTGAKLAAPAIEAVKKVKKAKAELSEELRHLFATTDMRAAAGKELEQLEAGRIQELHGEHDMRVRAGEELEQLESERIQRLIEVSDMQAKAGKEIEELNKQTQKTDDFAKQMGMSFSSAFEGAISGGKKLSDLFKGLAQDILQIMTRKMITEPLGNMFTQMLQQGTTSGGGGFNWSSLMSIAGSYFGGGSTYGGMTTQAFAAGTDYVPRDMIARVHEGEAIIPASENRGGGGRSVEVNFQINSLDPRTAAQVIMQNAEAIKGVIRRANADHGRSTPY